MMSLSKYSPGRRTGKLSIIIAILWLAALLGEAPPARAQEAGQVKAAILYNFAKFVEWPPGTFADERAPILLCYFPQDPMGAALETLQGKVVQGRRLEVRKSRSPEDLKRCQIFFAGPSEESALPQVLGALRRSPVLTITDEVDNFAKMGGIINLIPVEGKIRFEICLPNATQSGLKISSQLLKLAKTINP